MPSIEKIIEEMARNPKGCKFSEVKKVCDAFFGTPRIHGSHHVYKMPWKDDPRVNIQNRKNQVAEYQVLQVLKAIERMEAQDG